MGIYQRDNINYQSMIDNMIRNRNEGARIRSDNIRNQGDIWANVVNNLGQIGSQTAQYYQTREDKLADAKAAYEQKVAERIAQQQFQKEMQDAQFKHAEALQKAQQLEQKGYKEDEWQRNYELASAEYDAAMADWVKDKTNEVKKARLNKAATNMNYWGGKRGYNQVNPFDIQSEVPANTPVSTGDVTQPIATFDNSDLINNIDEVLKGKHTNASKAKAQTFIDQIQDAALKSQYQQRLDNRGLTSEEALEAANAELNKEWNSYQKTGKFNTKKFKLKFVNGKVVGLVRK